MSEPLWPLGSYQAYVVAEGYSQARTEEWKAVAGETHDFGDITLTAAMAALAQIGLRIGYPHPDRLVTMAWGLVHVPSHGPWLWLEGPSREMSLLSALGFVAPEAVCPRLEALQTIALASDPAEHSPTVTQFLTIAGQVDPELARETMNALLERVDWPPPQRLMQTLDHAIGRLLASPEDRYRAAMSSRLSFVPGDEDRLDD